MVKPGRLLKLIRL